jgi:hypothetical protein
MPISIHIEHLILEDTPFAKSDAATFRAALERELSSLASTTDASGWSSTRSHSIQASVISPPQSSISTWAATSAQSLFNAIAKPER